MKKAHTFLGALLLALTLGCSDKVPPPSNYAELEERIQNAVKKNDLNEIESLFFEIPQEWRNSRGFMKQVLATLSDSDITASRVEFLHSPESMSRAWSIEPEEFLRLQAVNNESTFTMTFPLGESKGAAYIVFPSGAATSGSPTELTYNLVSTPKSDLGKQLTTTFESSWDGSNFRSYSMDNLAETLTRFSGINILNKTSIAGDYDFVLKFTEVRDPSQIKIDLQSIGLDLVKEEEIQQDGGGQPATRPQSNDHLDYNL